ncbi:hypothetical protein QUF76_13185 [Desulfobacterales bacterium HSG16]|nr:hypothetical protein [Desulfobacterales bacterium HSG16]
MNEQNERSENFEIRWHRWFGTVFEEVLTPLGLEVQTSHPVMIDPPEADVVIIRKKGMAWTPEQLEVLPDGVRDSKASHVIIEFKNTESITEESLFVIGGYRVFYKKHRKLKEHDVQAFIASSKTPSRKTLEKHGYRQSDKAGIYNSPNSMVNLLPLISLNDLADEPYNDLYRLFGSKKKEKSRALKRLIKTGITRLPGNIAVFIVRIAHHLLQIGGTEIMDLTTEDKSFLWRFYEEFILPGMSPEEIGKSSVIKNMLKKVSVKDLFKEIPVKNLQKVPVEDRLKGLTSEEIEEYLETLKKQEQ